MNKPIKNYEGYYEISDMGKVLSLKGRMKIPTTIRKGEKNPLAKLTEKIVFSIRNSNLKGRELAKIYKVTPSTICDIRCKRTWMHI